MRGLCPDPLGNLRKGRKGRRIGGGTEPAPPIFERSPPLKFEFGKLCITVGYLQQYLAAYIIFMLLAYT